MLPEIQCARDIWLLVRQYGFLPLFRSRIPGFSIEDCTPPRLWFSDTEPGPWEWKGPVIRMGGCVYGKFFSGKAGYISLEWFPDFANFRRDGYDFDARWDDGLASMKDRQGYEAVADSAPILTGDLKRRCGYGPQGTRALKASSPGCKCRPMWLWTISPMQKTSWAGPTAGVLQSTAPRNSDLATTCWKKPTAGHPGTPSGAWSRTCNPCFPMPKKSRS